MGWSMVEFQSSFKIGKRKIIVFKIGLEEVNSPNRGWFKLSFGGSLKNYFEVKKVNFK